MTPQTPSSAGDQSPRAPWTSTWAVLTQPTVTWRQATEGWAILTTFGVLAVAAGVSFKVAQVLRRLQ